MALDDLETDIGDFWRWLLMVESNSFRFVGGKSFLAPRTIENVEHDMPVTGISKSEAFGTKIKLLVSGSNSRLKC